MCRQISQDFENNKLELARLEQMIILQQDSLTDKNKNQEIAIQRRNFLYVPSNLEPRIQDELSK